MREKHTCSGCGSGGVLGGSLGVCSSCSISGGLSVCSDCSSGGVLNSSSSLGGDGIGFGDGYGSGGHGSGSGGPGSGSGLGSGLDSFGFICILNLCYKSLKIVKVRFGIRGIGLRVQGLEFRV